MEADFEKSNDDVRERTVMLVATLLLVSAVVHVALMFSVSGYSFTPMAESGAAELKKAKALRSVGVRRLERDPLRAAKCDVQPPAPPPDRERQTDRVERLSGDVASEIAPRGFSVTVLCSCSPSACCALFFVTR